MRPSRLLVRGSAVVRSGPGHWPRWERWWPAAGVLAHWQPSGPVPLPHGGGHGPLGWPGSRLIGPGAGGRSPSLALPGHSRSHSVVRH